MHEQWTDKLSDYLDGELPSDERYAVESHVSGCAHCSGILAELKRVVACAGSIEPHPPQADLWPLVAERIEASSSSANVMSFGGTAQRRVPLASRRISFSLPQLAAAAVLLIAVSGGLVWSILDSRRADLQVRSDDGSIQRDASSRGDVPPPHEATADRRRPGEGGHLRAEEDVQIVGISFADQQYDAAVSDLEKALHRGRGRLDANTIAIVEHNLQIIDQAIAQARQALDADPANSYLSSHLVEARRRKLDLLRRAAALTSELD
jgi:Putative zinc-finger